jgi:predicted permease
MLPSSLITTQYYNQFIPLIILITIGYISKRKGLFTQEAIKPFNELVVKFALPSLIFINLVSVDLTRYQNVIWNLIFTGLFAGIITGLITFLIFRKYPHTKKFSLIIPTMMGQTAFMGYPIINGIGGENGLIAAILYDISTYIIFSLLKIILVATSKEESNKIKFNDKIKPLVKSIISTPVIWAILFGIFFGFGKSYENEIIPTFVKNYIIHLPKDYFLIYNVIEHVLKYLGDVSTPLIMILLGITIDFKGLLNNLKITTIISSIKLILLPVITFIIYLLISMRSTIDINQPVILIEAAMPCALISLNLGISYDLDTKLISDCIVVSLIFSIVTVFILSMLLDSNYLNNSELVLQFKNYLINQF